MFINKKKIHNTFRDHFEYIYLLSIIYGFIMVGVKII